ncbi:MAG: hypothetical protein FWG40_04820 [Peptococcaceae bacterium]|nr:hypothetical protein [Peptococcaceae bacterium]
MKTYGRIRAIGWGLFVLGFLVPFLLIMMSEKPFETPLHIVLMAVFFGGSMVLIIDWFVY